jgi:hypothetical protein
MLNKTIRRGLALAGVGVLSLSIGAVGAAGHGNHGKGLKKGHIKAHLSGNQCAQEKKALGNDAFDELYGKPSMKNCKAANAATVNAAVKNASQACKAERAELGAEAFAEKYGSNKNRKNAFGKCVSRGAKPAVNEETQERINAAKACKAEQADPNFAATHDGKTFSEFYGTNPNDKNAFGKCVSTKVQTPPAPAPTA